MKIYCLEFVSTRDGAAERIWHTNRRALERYARTMAGASFQVRGIRAFDMPVPVTESRMVAFLNAHCSSLAPPDLDDHQSRGRRTGAGSRS